MGSAEVLRKQSKQQQESAPSLSLAAAEDNKTGNVGHRQRLKSSAAQRLWSNIFTANSVYHSP
jgi:hypothetical protein